MAAVAIPNQSSSSIIVTTKKQRPPRELWWGIDKVGKTSFVAKSGGVFVAPEDGFGDITPTPPHFPEPAEGWAGNWPALLSFVETMAPGGAEHGKWPRLVFDSLDWIERDVLVPWLCKQNKWATAEDSPYQSIWKFALIEWRKLLFLLEKVNQTTGVAFIAHSMQKKISNPEGADYEKYVLSMNDKAAALFRQWVDVVGFCAFRTVLEVDEKTKKAKAFGGRARVLHLDRTAAFDAGNRFNLPVELPLSWDEYDAALRGDGIAIRADRISEQLRAALVDLADAALTEKLLKHIPAEVKLAKEKNDLRKLTEWLNKVNAKIQEKNAEANNIQSNESKEVDQ
jgi:hypothetical protein